MQKVACHICKAPARFHFNKDAFPIFRCSKCKTLFLHPIPETTKEIYSTDYFSGAEGGHGYVDYDADKEAMRAVFESYLDIIEKLKPERTSLFDVGAATGYFIARAKERGWTTAGVEIAPYAADIGRKKGNNITTGVLGDVPADTRYDVMTMWDLIEHVPDPRGDLQKASELLNAGGLLLINTPDAGSIYAKIMGPGWHLLVPPEHIFYFTQAGLSQLLFETGIEVVSIQRIGKRFTLEYILHMLFKWQKLTIWKKMLYFVKKYPRISLLSFPINLGDNMFVVARKK